MLIGKRIIKELDVQRLSDGPSTQLISYSAKTRLYVVGDEAIELAAQDHYTQMFGSDVKSHHVREILHAVKRNVPPISAEALNDPKHGIVIFPNVVLKLPEMEPQSHSPNWLYTIGIPHNYNSDSSCKRFDAFMNEVLPENVHPLIKQIMGYLLIPSTAFRKLFVFLGVGSNGKSTLIRVIEAVLGRDNVSHQSLHGISENRFSASELFGKLANTYADLDDRDLRHSGLLKQIVSGDSLQFEKKHKNPFSAPVTARLLFSANEMPIIRDTSEAITDRLILIEFPNRFEEDKQDKQLGQKLTEETEIEGIIVRWAMPGLLSLLETGKFEVPNRCQQLLRHYRRDCDPFVEFAEEQIAPDGWVKKEELYQAYAFWSAYNNKRTVLSREEFNHRISRHFSIPNDDRRSPDSRERAWFGIKLKAAEADPSRESQAVLTYGGKKRIDIRDIDIEKVGKGRDSRDQELVEISNE